MSKNKFSVKSSMHSLLSSRTRVMDGPWKPSVEAAVKAFVESLRKKGFETNGLSQVFVAERTEKDNAPMQDVRGNFYKNNADGTNEIQDLLEAEGVRVYSVALPR